jgi:hypothetical protein
LGRVSAVNSASSSSAWSEIFVENFPDCEKLRQERHLLKIISPEYAAPDGAKKHFYFRFYKYAAPTALDEIRFCRIDAKPHCA